MTTSLQRIIWFGLSSITFIQGTTSFVEFIAPLENEVIVENSTFRIEWVSASSTSRRGTMILLGGQTSESLSKIWEIAYSIDVTEGKFAWPVGSPTLGAQLSNFYGLNFSLDGIGGVFSISPPFKIVPEGASSSVRGRGHGHDNDHESEGGNDDDGDNTGDEHDEHKGFTPMPTTVTSMSIYNPPKGSGGDANRQSNTTMPTTITSTPTNNSAKGTIPKSSNVLSSSRATMVRSPVPGPRISKGALVGIVLGITAAVIAFFSLIGLVVHYRGRLLGKAGYFKSEGGRKPRGRWQICKSRAGRRGTQAYNPKNL
ncbi:hypothetical protein F4803DRAFT_525471 [Xylaria telfairii]|nr:hypothetical protein F4803DRAFT_525471 [Xylaria telfairii]